MKGTFSPARVTIKIQQNLSPIKW